MAYYFNRIATSWTETVSGKTLTFKEGMTITAFSGTSYRNYSSSSQATGWTLTLPIIIQGIAIEREGTDQTGTTDRMCTHALQCKDSHATPYVFYINASDVVSNLVYTLKLHPNGSNATITVGGTTYTNTAATYDPAGVGGVQVGTKKYNAIATSSRPNYIFLGYYTAASGGTQVYDGAGVAVTGNSYWDADGYWIYRGNPTFYAHWQASGTLVAPTVEDWVVTDRVASSNRHVLFLKLTGGNFGSLLAPTWTDAGGQDDLKWDTTVYGPTSSSSPWTRNNRVFDWALRHDHDTSISPTELIHIHLYAYLEEGVTAANRSGKTSVIAKAFDIELCPVITFNGNGGTSSQSSKNVDANFTIGTLPTATRPGYRFDGWYDTSSFGNEITTTTKFYRSKIIYAGWLANQLIIYSYANGGEMIDPHRPGAYVDSDGKIYNPYGEDFILSYYGDSSLDDGFWDTNNQNYVNLGKTGYHTEAGTEWNTAADGSGTSFDMTVVWDDTVRADIATALGQDLLTSSVYGNVYANWKPNRTTLTLNASSAGGTYAGTTPRTMTYNASTNYSVGTATKSGATFIGWYTSATGGSQVFNSSGNAVARAGYWSGSGSSAKWIYTTSSDSNWLDSTTAASNTLTLYARFSYAVSYNGNASTIDSATVSNVPSAQAQNHGQALTLSSTVPTATAKSYTDTVNFNANGGTSTGATNNKLTASRSVTFTFSKWNTNSAGTGTNYNAGGSYSANVAATLYAQWTKNNGTSTFTLPTPTPSAGYQCTGWYTSGGSLVGQPGDTYTITSNALSGQSVTLYAHWEPVNVVYIRQNGVYLQGIMLKKINGVYTAGTVFARSNETYKEYTI